MAMSDLENVDLSKEFTVSLWRTRHWYQYDHYHCILFTIDERVNSLIYSSECFLFVLSRRIVPTVTELNKLQSILNVEHINFPLYLRVSYIVEIICVLFFTLELNLRILSTPRLTLLFNDIFNLLDLVNFSFQSFIRDIPSRSSFSLVHSV